MFPCVPEAGRCPGWDVQSWGCSVRGAGWLGDSADGSWLAQQSCDSVSPSAGRVRSHRGLRPPLRISQQCSINKGVNST